MSQPRCGCFETKFFCRQCRILIPGLTRREPCNSRYCSERWNSLSEFLAVPCDNCQGRESQSQQGSNVSAFGEPPVAATGSQIVSNASGYPAPAMSARSSTFSGPVTQGNPGVSTQPGHRGRNQMRRATDDSGRAAAHRRSDGRSASPSQQQRSDMMYRQRPDQELPGGFRLPPSSLGSDGKPNTSRGQSRDQFSTTLVRRETMPLPPRAPGSSLSNPGLSTGFPVYGNRLAATGFKIPPGREGYNPGLPQQPEPKDIFKTPINAPLTDPAPTLQELLLPEKRATPMPLQQINNWQSRYPNGPVEHIFRRALADRRYYEPQEWELWRANPTADHAIMNDRYARAEQQSPDWPLPLPYEPYITFIDRQRVQLERNNMANFWNQWWWRQTHDKTLAFPDLANTATNKAGLPKSAFSPPPGPGGGSRGRGGDRGGRGGGGGLLRS